VGWYRSTSEKDRVRAPLSGRDGSDAAWDLIRTAWASVAVMPWRPMQDILNLGRKRVGTFPASRRALGLAFPRRSSTLVLDRLADLTQLYGRVND